MGYYNVVMDMQDLISMILRCTEGNITAGPGLAASWLYMAGGVTESLSHKHSQVQGLGCGAKTTQHYFNNNSMKISTFNTSLTLN